MAPGARDFKSDLGRYRTLEQGYKRAAEKKAKLARIPAADLEEE